MPRILSDFRSKLNRPALAGLYYSASTVLMRGASVIFTPLYTRMLTKESYGIYSLYVGYMSIFSVFITLELNGSAIYKGLSQARDGDGFISSAQFLLLGAFSVFLSLALIFLQPLSAITGLSGSLVILLCVQTLADGVLKLRLAKDKYGYRFKLSIIEGIIIALGSPLLTVILFNVFGRRELARIVAMLVSTLIISIPLAVNTFMRARGKLISRSDVSFLLKYLLPQMPYFLLSSLYLQIGRTTIMHSFGTESVALYSLALSIGHLPTLLTVGISSALIPWCMRRLNEGESGSDRIYRIVESIALPYGILILLFLSFCPELLKIMAPESYSSALPAAYAIAICTLPSFLNTVCSSLIAGNRKSFFLSIGSVISTLALIILNVLLTPRLGFVATAVIQIVANLLTLSFYFYVLKNRIHSHRLPAGRLLGYCILLIPCAFIILMFKEILFSRLLLAIALTVALFGKAGEIVGFIKEKA